MITVVSSIITVSSSMIFGTIIVAAFGMFISEAQYIMNTGDIELFVCQVDMKKEVLFNYEWLHTKLRAMSLPDLLSDFQYAMEHSINDQEVRAETSRTLDTCKHTTIQCN